MHNYVQTHSLYNSKCKIHSVILHENKGTDDRKLNKNREIAIKNDNFPILANFHINFPLNNFAYPTFIYTYFAYGSVYIRKQHKNIYRQQLYHSIFPKSIHYTTPCKT